jgi:hypothetical protein
MPDEPKVQEPPAEMKPADGDDKKSLHWLKPDRSLRPDGFHLEGEQDNRGK